MGEEVITRGAVIERPPETDPNGERLSQEDRGRWYDALALTQDRDRLRLVQEAMVQKWSGVRRDGSYNPLADWLGEGAEKRGYPKLARRHQLAMAMVLENQARFQRAKKMRVVNGEVIVQDTTTADEALPTKFVFPLVRRIYAQIFGADWMDTQPMPGPTAFVFFFDFLREADSTNLLSVEYNWMLNGELSVPPKGKLSLSRTQIQAVKQIMGMEWSLEAMEDAQAQLNLDVEQELINAFGQEFIRTLYARHLLQILTAAGQASIGASLPALWANGPAVKVLPDKGGNSYQDYKSIIYSSLIDANTTYQRLNRTVSDGIVAGYGLAGFLNKMLTATSTSNPADDNTEGLGITNYGVYNERWRIWGTEFLPDNVGFLYKRNADTLRAGLVYAPYVPMQVMPAMYAGYDPSTGNFQNRDAMTRNIRERSASVVTRPYAFVQIQGPAGGLSQL